MLELGLKARNQTVVALENMAITLGSGDLEVFATPAMVALMEGAAMQAVASELSEEDTTVGAAMNTSHIKPSAKGDTITATAELIAVEGRKLVFAVEAVDSMGETVGKGEHVRYVVNRQKFMSKMG